MELVGARAATCETECPVTPTAATSVQQALNPPPPDLLGKNNEPSSEAPLPVMRIWTFLIPYRYVALFALVLQTVLSIYVMRISRTESEGGKYLITTAVAVAEMVKFVCSFLLLIHGCYQSERLRCLSRSPAATGLPPVSSSRPTIFGAAKVAYGQCKEEIVGQPLNTLRVGVPAVLYTLQNNLLFIALSNMSGAVYQITYQLKILSTALLSVVILHKRFSLDQWLSLFILTGGVVIIQLPTGNKNASVASEKYGDPTLGMFAVLAACMTSGLAGVYLEKVLKNSAASIWLRNMQLGLLGTMLALLGCWHNDRGAIREKGFFQGYNKLTWLAILLQSAGGLIVAAVLKYADNILKCFGNALAIILSCLVSYFFVGDYQPSLFFAAGATMVVTATYTYGTSYPMIGSPKVKKFLRRCVEKRQTVEVTPV